MRVGIFRRLASFVLDAMPILLIVTLLFNLFVGDLLKEEGYDELVAEYQTIDAAYYDSIEPFQIQFEDGDISEDEYLNLIEDDYNTFIEDTQEHREAILFYVMKSIIYHFVLFTVLYYVYNLILKGATYGRRLMGIELGGKINWWTLFVREVLYKMFFWLITLFVLGIGIDIAAILFSKRKKAPRDFVSNIYVKFIGVDYPF